MTPLDLPTPFYAIHPDRALRDLWVKNDGLPALPYGGNKVRKLAYILPAVLSRGKSSVLTFGAAGSHHALATAIYCARAGLHARALLTPQARTEHSEQVLRAAYAAGLEIIPTRGALGLGQALARHGRRSDFWLGPGGLGSVGTQGYFQAAFELGAQLAQNNLEQLPRVILAAGSGSTAAGLLAGSAAQGGAFQVVVVGVARQPWLRELILAQALALWSTRWQDRLDSGSELHARAPRRPRWDELNSLLHVVTTWIGPGYGQGTESTRIAAAIAARVGIQLDVTYTARAFAQALREVGHPAFGKAGAAASGPVVYWHTLSEASMEPLLARAPKLEELPASIRQLLVTRGALSTP